MPAAVNLYGASMSNNAIQPGAAFPNLAEILIQTADMPWREKSLKGLHEKMLWRDEATSASIALIRFEKGVGIP